VQKALAAGDIAAAKAALPAAQAAASTDDDKYAIAGMAYQIAQKSNDAAGASAAVDAMLASGKAPADVQIQLLTAKGQNAFNSGKFADADAAFTQLAQLKSNDPDMADAYPRADIWRLALQTYRDTNRLDQQTDLDTLRLMRAANALAGERDYYEYANMALNKGFPGEAKAVIDFGTSSNMVDSKALATSKALAEIKAVAGPKVAADKAELPVLDKKARAAADGKQALLTGDAYLGYGQYAQAADLYKVALQKGGVDANVTNLHLGQALAQAGQKADAAKVLGTVTGQNQALAQYWAIWANKGSAPAAPAAPAAR
jgi:hypothetical protein